MATSTEKYNPFVERNVKHPTKDWETFIHLLKGSLGAGVMAMPKAFQQIGLWLGIPAAIFVCFIATYCIHMLVRVAQTLCVRCRMPRLSYADTAEQTFRSDPKELIKWGIAMRYTVHIFLAFNALGCVCIYLVNTGRNLQEVVNDQIPTNPILIRHWILILGAPMLLLCLVRDLKYLVPFSMLANILVFTSLIIVFYFIFADLPNPKERTAVADIKTWAGFFSISIFALENVGVILPCENEMKKPEHFTGCPSVLVAAMSVISFLYTFLGFFGYLRYGDDIRANITLNLPDGSALAISVKIMIAVAVYFTILLQFYVAFHVIWSCVKTFMPDSSWDLIIEMCLRLGVMLFCIAMATIFPDLGPFISFIGAVTFSNLGLTFPAIFDLVVFRVDPGYGFLKIHLIKDILIIIFGLSICIFGTILSIEEFKFEKFQLTQEFM